MVLTEEHTKPLFNAVADASNVSGYTHIFYRYPARFSPTFASTAIELFTEPGDLVYDPFVGGGTTLVEAFRLGRSCIGTDINSLAKFVSEVKFTILDNDDIATIRTWIDSIETNLKLNKKSVRPIDWIEKGYQRNLQTKTTWPIRKLLELAIESISRGFTKRQENFIRCLLLRTSQWGLDCRSNNPSVNEFRNQLKVFGEEMIKGAIELREAVSQGVTSSKINVTSTINVYNMAVTELVDNTDIKWLKKPKLILTSPPYPGVHVLYHRWQVHGRRETPAPYWITNSLDSKGESYYTFGGRNQHRLKGYFKHMAENYSAIASLSESGTWLVQLVAFSEPDWQLPTFLSILNDCGFIEIDISDTYNNTSRYWRKVPNRKFYADLKGNTPSSKEVLLIHKRQ